MAAGGLFAVSGFWFPTGIFVPPRCITQCIDIFREIFVRSSITNSKPTRHAKKCHCQSSRTAMSKKFSALRAICW
jgi:hypothetical protein